MCGCEASAFLLLMEVLTIAKLDHQLNEEIRDKEIRLIGEDGASWVSCPLLKQMLWQKNRVWIW